MPIQESDSPSAVAAHQRKCYCLCGGRGEIKWGLSAEAGCGLAAPAGLLCNLSILLILSVHFVGLLMVDY
jgi:hypothetical protein